jgi:hypothetical protein
MLDKNSPVDMLLEPWELRDRHYLHQPQHKCSNTEEGTADESQCQALDPLEEKVDPKKRENQHQKFNVGA